MCYYEIEIYKSFGFVTIAAHTALHQLFEYSRCPTAQLDNQNWISYNPLKIFALTKTLQWNQKWHSNITEAMIVTVCAKAEDVFIPQVAIIN
ncbi:hypothetical protein CDAR_495881 [Caerostris darwini]|uniref:Uncharacterized protein n=1 Tax=Caerostris darwini TaxID=1538125 RepID=A0AAV4PZ03_9ARAC|nr:hypothetical protein CDAR_495881 [Caerostris darwini]